MRNTNSFKLERKKEGKYKLLGHICQIGGWSQIVGRSIEQSNYAMESQN